MKPYYEKDGIVIYHGDCNAILPKLKPVDVIVTDPPWKASKGRISYRREGDGMGVAPAISHSLSYGDIGVFDPLALQTAYSLASFDCVTHCGYMELGEVIGLQRKLRGVFVWHDLRHTPIPGPVSRRDISFLVWGGKKTSTRNGSWESCVFSQKSLQAGCMATERIRLADGSTAHPSQEPLGLYRWILQGTEGTVLDPFMGSGTTLVAAKELGRKAIGIEIEEKYCEIAAKRLAQDVFDFSQT